MKILIIQTAFIGDVILTTPLIKNIKKYFSESIIDFLTIPKSANLIEKDLNISELIIFDKNGIDKGYKGFNRLKSKIRNKSYDICICPHRSLRSALLAHSTKANIRIGFDNSVWKGAFNRLIHYDQTKHETQRNLNLLQALNVNTADTRPVIYSDKNDEEFVDSIITGNENWTNKNKIVVAPGSVWATKRWPTNHYISVIRKLESESFQVLLVGSEQDFDLCNEIKGKSEHAINFAGKFTLRQTKYLLTQCQGILSNDSAPLHLGLAANIPVFAIFGPTIKQFGFSPIEENSFLIENENLNCRPCGIHGSYKCPTKTFDCMYKINEQQVTKIILSYYN